MYDMKIPHKAKVPVYRAPLYIFLSFLPKKAEQEGETPSQTVDGLTRT